MKKLIFIFLIILIQFVINSSLHGAQKSSTTYKNIWVLMLMGDFHEDDGKIDLDTMRAFEGNVRNFSALMIEEFNIPQNNIHLESNLIQGIGWLNKKSNNDDLIIIHFSAHGLHANGKKTGFGIRLDKDYSYSDIGNFLNILDGHYRHLILIVDACHSGGFIESCKKENSWIFTATAKDEFEYGNRLFLKNSPSSDFSKMLFTANFISALKSSKTWNEAFNKSRASWIQVLRVAKLLRPAPQSFLPNEEDLPLPYRKVASTRKTFSNSIGMKFMLIPAGSFVMGSPSGEPGRDDRDNYETQHKVTITKSFYMQTTEVTQGQWVKIMGNNPSAFKKCGADCPVNRVSWNDIQEFIRLLNQKEGIKKYRLPTEAEWEYSCRAGTTTPFNTGKCLSTDQANYNSFYSYSRCPSGGIKRDKIIKVGSFSPNSWGLYDMHGNVGEFCQDWVGGYPNVTVIDPKGPSSGHGRIVRGGGWTISQGGCRSASRTWFSTNYRSNQNGFRLLRLSD